MQKLKLRKYKNTFDVVLDTVVPATLTVPPWYKNSPQTCSHSKILLTKEGVSTGTYKKCSPFLDALTLGYQLTLAVDLEITNENDRPYVTSSYLIERQIISKHSLEQMQGLEVPLFHYPDVFKFEQVVTIETPKEYSLLFTHPLNRFDLPFTTISGVVETDQYNMSVQIPFFVKQGWLGIIKKGTPIAQLIPIKRESWERIEEKEITQDEGRKKNQEFRSIIERPYKTLFWRKKIYT